MKRYYETPASETVEVKMKTSLLGGSQVGAFWELDASTFNGAEPRDAWDVD